MSSSTPIYGWPYQGRLDRPHGPNLGEDLALAIEATLAALDVPSLPRGIMATPSNTGTNGTATTGTTQLKDSQLPDYTFTADATRLYRVVYDGFNAGGGTANDRFLVAIRDGGAGTPVLASPVVGHDLPIKSETIAIGHILSATFTATAGVHTLNAFYVRSSGSGVLTPTGSRNLYVEDIGAA